MLLNAVKVINSRGSELPLPFEDISNGYAVKMIEGLDPVKANLVSSSFANMDGEQYHSSRRDPRNIKLTLGLEPDHILVDVKDLRDALYQFFMPKSKISFVFTMYDKQATDVTEEFKLVNIEGYIETFDCDIFAPKVEAVISVMCFNPDFYDPIGVVFEGMTVADTTEVEISYEGTVDTGVVFTLRPDRSLTDFTIYQRTPDGNLITVYFAYALLAGDVVVINSILGSKLVTVTRAGVVSSVLYAVSPQSGWLTLLPGDNSIRVHAEGAPIPYEVDYIVKYGGL